MGQFRDELEVVQIKLDAIDKRMKELTSKECEVQADVESKQWGCWEGERPA